MFGFCTDFFFLNNETQLVLSGHLDFFVTFYSSFSVSRLGKFMQNSG